MPDPADEKKSWGVDVAGWVCPWLSLFTEASDTGDGAAHLPGRRKHPAVIGRVLPRESHGGPRARGWEFQQQSVTRASVRLSLPGPVCP